MVPLEFLPLKTYHGNDCEHRKRYHLLQNFQLKQRERAAVVLKAYAVGGYHYAVFEKRNSPRNKDDYKQGPALRYATRLEFQVPVPRKCHEYVGNNEENYSNYGRVHCYNI